VSNTSGNIEVRGWSRNEVHIEGELGNAVDELEFERSREEINIIVRVPRNHSRSISSDLTIRIPQGSRLRVGTVSADITVSGVHGAQDLHTVSGDIDSEAFGADVEIESVSGDIEVQGDDQDAQIEMGTVSGNIDVQNVAGEAGLGSVTGDLAVIDSSFDRIRMNTTNGDIVFRASLNDGGRLDAETINGGVDINFEGPLSARFNVETFNGRIDNCFGPDAVEISRYTPGSELRFTEGSGAGRVDINTLNGRIRLCKD
jgi:DUF4097 and DUF4098 domain-containing protein YvlB